MLDHQSGLDFFEGPDSLRSLSSSGPLLSLWQLVNRLGSTRGGGELYMQSPALRARDQHHREQIVAAVEGRFCVCDVSVTREFLALGWNLHWSGMSLVELKLLPLFLGGGG